MQNFWRRATSHLEVVKTRRMNHLTTHSPSSLDDAYPLDPQLKKVWQLNSFLTQYMYIYTVNRIIGI